MSSLHGSAQLTTVIEVDVEEVLRLRRQIGSEGGAAPSLLGFFSRGAVLALREHPVINSSLSESSELTCFDVEHVGMAVDTPKGLMVPVIRNAGDLGALELTDAIRDVAERTREGRITPAELAGGTFTITNTGSRKALFDTPIINQPQSAILGIGAVVPRPVAIADGEGHYRVEVRSMMYLALSYDHRVVDGADAARYLDTVRGLLAEPRGLLDAPAEVVA